MVINSAETQKPKNLVHYGRWHDQLVFGVDLDARHCTRLLGELVVYPRQTYDLGRSIAFQRLDDGVYRFEIRSNRYLGRGTVVMSAKIGGIIRQQADGTSLISAESSQAWFYLIALILMTIFVAVSYVMVRVTILFLPLALLMSAVLVLHWGFLLDDRHALVRDMVDRMASSSKKELL